MYGIIVVVIYIPSIYIQVVINSLNWILKLGCGLFKGTLNKLTSYLEISSKRKILHIIYNWHWLQQSQCSVDYPYFRLGTWVRFKADLKLASLFSDDVTGVSRKTRRFEALLRSRMANVGCYMRMTMVSWSNILKQDERKRKHNVE